MNQKNNYNQKRKNFLKPNTYNLVPSGGFTLVELIVSLGLFTIVIMAAIGSLYSVNATARRVESMRSVLDNLNFAIESMSRTIRTGTHVGCFSSGNDRPFGDFNPCDQITVEGTLGTSGTVQYRWALNGSTNTGKIERTLGGQWVALTAPGIDIQHLSFFVEGAPESDQLQPKVIMLVQGVATAGENVAPFAVQTQVSLRTVEE